MKKPVFTDAFFESLANSALAVNAAETLPPECYTDREFFEFEKDALFYREWLCVGREDWVRQPGDYLTTSHVGEPILVVRNSDGILKAFSSVCRHRAMLVAEGAGNVKAFLCPYHHWSYSLDGKLIGAPAMERACNFNKDAVGLPEFRVEVWLGFIFVNFDPEAQPLAPRLGALTQVLANYELDKADCSPGPRVPCSHGTGR